MSDNYDSPAAAGSEGGVAAEDVAPGGPPSETVEPAGQGEAEAPPAEPTYFDPTTYSDHLVRVKVDGEEVEVPLSEALSGYSRTADYTRKTQSLAEQQREAQFAITLHKALENNPQATLRLLQEQYAEPETPADDDEAWLDDPVESRFREYDQRIQRYEQYQADQELRTALRVLQQRYGEGFNPTDVVARAAQQNRMDLEAVYKEMAFDQMWTQQQAQAEAARRREADEASRTAAKAGVTAHSGGSANGAVADQSGSATTVSQAFYDAKKALGL